MKIFTGNIETQTERLMQLINNKRNEMVKTAENFGTNSEKTLECSQELDTLIVQYQRLGNQKGQTQHESYFTSR